MTKKEIMNRLDTMKIEYDKKAKKADLEQLLTEAEQTEAEQTEAEQTEAEQTYADLISNTELTLEQRLAERNHNLISAHGGFALRRNRKRICEVSQSKRTKLYKVAFHKDTYERAKIFIDSDIFVEEQKLNMIVRNLTDAQAFRLIEVLDRNK